MTHRRDPEALVVPLARVGAGVKGLESVSVYLNKIDFKITNPNHTIISINTPPKKFFGHSSYGYGRHL